MNAELKAILDRDRTQNQRDFAAWLVGNAGLTFKSKAAEEAFVLGAMLGATSYHVFQGEKRDARRAAEAEVAPVRRPRKTKAAAA